MDDKEKRDFIRHFIDNEFDLITSIIDIEEKIINIGEECKKEIMEEIYNFEKQTLKAIGILVDRLGKEKGIEQLKLNFRQFNL
jgi:hypothetical protein